MKKFKSLGRPQKPRAKRISKKNFGLKRKRFSLMMSPYNSSSYLIENNSSPYFPEEGIKIIPSEPILMKKNEEENEEEDFFSLKEFFFPQVDSAASTRIPSNIEHCGKNNEEFQKE